MSRASANQYAVGATVFAGRGTLTLINGFNASTNLRYFFLVDAAAIAAGHLPTAADIVNVIAVGPSGNFSYTPSPNVPPIGVALTWAVSTTPTPFAASTDVFYVHSEYNTDAPP